ncbi:MAG: dehydrogenase [Blastopirellula sp.]|nr:MAG: dehydrogenase [Blastopirellula sp.]
MLRLTAEKLQSFATSLLTAAGIPGEEAEATAASLVGSNLRGYESHGVMRIPFYVDMIANGEVQLDAEFEVEKETDTNLVVNANWGLGQSHARLLADRLIEKAKTSGIGIGTMYRSGHIGRLGEYCEMAAEQGMVAMVMVNTHGAARRVSPPGGKRPRLGTNPLAIGAPNGDSPLVLDFSTSATAEGKVRVKKIAGEQCPEGWLIDSDGNPTTDPNSIYQEPPGCIVPFGGPQMYKGFGLGIMVDILTGALSGGLCSRETPETQKGNCVFMLVVDPDHFGGRDHFAKEVGDLAQFVRDCPRTDGCDEILLPGDPERRVMKQRKAEGLPFDTENWSKLVQLAERLNVEVPELK